MEFKSYMINRLSGGYTDHEIRSLIKIIKEDMPGLLVLPVCEWSKVADRLMNSEPVQYITGVAPFYGHFFEVNEHTLIPRPETEELVYLVNSYLKSRSSKQLSIIDIGTGSGCIPISIKSDCPDTKISALDISQEALEVAKRNSKKLKAAIQFYHLDILDEATWTDIGNTYDVIISNPPYIPHSEKSKMHPNVLDYEPHVALFVENNDPLKFYRKILRFALKYLSKQGRIYLECNECNAQEVSKLYSDDYEVDLIKDMQGKERMIVAEWN